MKKRTKVVSVLFCTLLSFVSMGQSLNINGGYTLSKMKSEGMSNESLTETYNGTTYTRDYNNKMTSGFNAFIGYEFRLGKRLSLETGIKYQTRGYETVSTYTTDDGINNTNETSTMKMKFNYFDIPIVLNTSILVGDVNVYARTGVYGGVLGTMKYMTRGEYTSSYGDQGEYESEQSFSDFDFEDRITGGLIFGAGVEYKGVYFETNYSMGVYSLANFDYELYTHDLSFSIGYKIKFKK